MPYYVHPKDVDIDTADVWDIPCFDTAAKANAAIVDRATHKVSFRASEDETLEWKERESSRFRDDTYVSVPWSGSYAGDNGSEHYAHLSVKTPGLVAFTKSVEHGVQDRQTTMRPGRYLEQYYTDQFDAETVAQYIATCAAGNLELKIATSIDDVVTVYMSTSITSCMDGNHFRNRDRHPCQVYGDSDLAVAYFGPIDDINARAVCWPAKKRYSRLYGNTAVLESLLKSAGWTKGDLDGARIRAVEHRRGYVVPYIDYINRAESDGQWLVLGKGPIDCQETCGYATETNNTHDCANCGSEYEADEDEDCGYWCSSCEDDHGCCESCSNDIWFSNADHVTLRNGDNICERCADSRRVECAIEDCEERWINDESFTRAEQHERTRLHVDSLCADCASRAQYCDVCEETDVYDIDEYRETGRCTRGHTIRCDRTRDLLLSSMDIPAPLSDVMHGPNVDSRVFDSEQVYRDRGLDRPDHILCCVSNCHRRAEVDLRTFRQVCVDHYRPFVPYTVHHNGVSTQCETPF